MPTFLFFKNGEQVGKVMGADPNKLKVSSALYPFFRELLTL